MFEDVRDAEDALHYLDGTRLHGRELEIQYAEGDRKSKLEMWGKWNEIWSVLSLSYLYCSSSADEN